MQTLLIPHSSERNAAKIWAAVLGSNASPTGQSLRLFRSGQTPQTVPLPDGAWQPITAGGKLPAASRRNFKQTIRLAGLQPGSTYEVRSDGGSARFNTLPAALPRPGETPLKILLGSCFARENDKEGLAGNLARRVYSSDRWDFKVLCGDQVYLDIVGSSPVQFTTESEADLSEHFLAKYLANWTQDPGFQNLLDSGATYFTADDHEYWNNHPNSATLIPYTWFGGNRTKWAAIARGLFGEFQSDDPPRAGRARTFTIGRLSFFIADTRVNRLAGDTQLMDPADLTLLQQWVANLTGPGVLVVGQPIFTDPASFLAKRFADRRLSNYKQYTDIMRALLNTRWSVMVLSGDVHFGRVAECTLANGAKLIEVISSPLSLVSRLAGGSADDAPRSLSPVPGMPKLRIDTRPSTTPRNNFAVLHIHERPADIRVDVHYWFPQGPGAGGVNPMVVSDLRLPLV